MRYGLTLGDRCEIIKTPEFRAIMRHIYKGLSLPLEQEERGEARAKRDLDVRHIMQEFTINVGYMLVKGKEEDDVLKRLSVIPVVCGPYLLDKVHLPDKRMRPQRRLALAGRELHAHCTYLIDLLRKMGPGARFVMVPLYYRRHFLASLEQYAIQVVRIRYIRDHSMASTGLWTQRSIPFAWSDTWKVMNRELYMHKFRHLCALHLALFNVPVTQRVISQYSSGVYEHHVWQGPEDSNEMA